MKQDELRDKITVLEKQIAMRPIDSIAKKNVNDKDY